VRRLGRLDQARGFLLHADERFGPELRSCADAAALRPQGAARAALLARIDSAIAPFDVAGLGDRSREDRYPVRAEDLLAAAPRLGARREELMALLERCGFHAPGGRPAS
jgi:FADH2 O2-dependent halogenase